MRLALVIIGLIRKHAVFSMGSMILIGLLMLYLKLQNDLYSSALFLFKAVFFPLSLLFLVKLWSLALIISTPFSSLTQHGLLARTWSLGVALLFSLLFAPQLLPNWQQSPHFSQQANQQGFKVATFSAMTRSRNAQDIKSFIQVYQPDVLCLQEVTDEDMLVLSNLYPYEAIHGGSNLIILSQFPLSKSIDETETRQVKSIKNGVQSIELELPNQQRTRFLNIHMPRQYRQGGYFSKALEAIQLHTDTTLPIVFCGDFNMTPHHSLYTYMTQQLGFNDAQHNQTWQYGFTFPNGNRRLAYFGTWLRIDYLFSRGFLGGNTQVINTSNLSDHKAVLSTFLLPDKSLHSN